MPATAIITVDQYKGFVDVNHPTDTYSNDIISATILAVCEAMEQYLNRPLVARELNTYDNGGGTRIFLNHREPGYLSIGSVVENGETLTETDYKVYPKEGYVVRLSSGVLTRWAEGVQSVSITYTSGVAQSVEGIPENLKLVAKFATRFFMQAGPEVSSNRSQDGQYIRFDRFPRQCLWLMDPYRVVSA